MMELAPLIGKQKAHDLLHQLALKVIENKTNLMQAVLEEPLIAQSISSKRLKELMDPHNYLGLAQSMVEKVVKVGSA